jgi:hypothetical protein
MVRLAYVVMLRTAVFSVCLCAETWVILNILTKDSALKFKVILCALYIFYNFGLGSSSALLPPGSTATSSTYASGLLYYSSFSKRSYFGRQVPLASTTRGSPLVAGGGTVGEKWWPDDAWDMHPGFFYMPQICPLKIRRLRPGLNPRTWVSEASTLPLHHRSRYLMCIIPHKFPVCHQGFCCVF